MKGQFTTTQPRLVVGMGISAEEKRAEVSVVYPVTDAGFLC